MAPEEFPHACRNAVTLSIDDDPGIHRFSEEELLEEGCCGDLCAVIVIILLDQILRELFDEGVEGYRWPPVDMRGMRSVAGTL